MFTLQFHENPNHSNQKGLTCPKKKYNFNSGFQTLFTLVPFFPEFKKSGFDSSYISFMNLNEELQQITSFMLSW